MADLLRKYKSLYSSTANSFGTGEGETITPNSVSGLPTDTEIVLTFDRVNSQGTATPSLMERIKGTISGGNFVIASGGRGYDGTTEQAHTSPVVEMVWNAKDWNDMVVWAEVGHNQSGYHTLGASDTLTSSKFITALTDTNGNELIKVTATASAVNEFTVANAAPGSSPTLTASGEDTDISINLVPKGAGTFQVSGTAMPTASSTTTFTNKRITNRIQSVTDAATITPDADANDMVDITAIAQAFTIANPTGTPTNGQKLLIRWKDNGTARAITWGNGYVAGGAALPTTTTLSKIGYAGFIYNTANTLNKWQCVVAIVEA